MGLRPVRLALDCASQGGGSESISASASSLILAGIPLRAAISGGMSSLMAASRLVTILGVGMTVSRALR